MISELKSSHLFSRNKEKMSQLMLCIALIVFVENNLLLSVLGSCHLPVDLTNRVCESVGISELASDSDLLEGHISFFKPT